MKKINIILISLVLISAYCNPSSVDAPKKSWSGLHSVKINGIWHGSHRRSPFGYCDEANCHGLALQGGNTGAPSCYHCHGDLWNIWETHNVSLDGNRHQMDVIYLGVRTVGNPTADAIFYCGNAYCHGATLNGGSLGGPGCYNCHGSIPTWTGGGD